jgi:hypothetical protein
MVTAARLLNIGLLLAASLPAGPTYLATRDRWIDWPAESASPVAYPVEDTAPAEPAIVPAPRMLLLAGDQFVYLDPPGGGWWRDTGFRTPPEAPVWVFLPGGWQGRSPPQADAAVPEPGTPALVLLALAALTGPALRRGRRFRRRPG